MGMEYYQSENIETEEPIKTTETDLGTGTAIMKCKVCRGSGINEREAGLISWECPTCKGTGQVARENPNIEELDRVPNIPVEASKEIKVIDDKPDNNGDDLQQSPDGVGVDTPTPGSGVARKPAKPKKSQAKGKARKARR